MVFLSAAGFFNQFSKHRSSAAEAHAARLGAECLRNGHTRCVSFVAIPTHLSLQ
jgi:hypothetical protein